MIFTAHADGRCQVGDRIVRCALGRAGVIAATDKREGDGCTPLGTWDLRRVLYRPDRLAFPRTGLPTAEIGPADGWCDAASDPAYNRPVALPYPASCEAMWRADALYDMVCILGHNDGPPVAGRGSAIFLHVATFDYRPTEGCVALALADLTRLLSLAQPGDALAVTV